MRDLIPTNVNSNCGIELLDEIDECKVSVNISSKDSNILVFDVLKPSTTSEGDYVDIELMFFLEKDIFDKLHKKRMSKENIVLVDIKNNNSSASDSFWHTKYSSTKNLCDFAIAA